MKAASIPTMNSIVQYLDITPNQEYLVDRLKGRFCNTVWLKLIYDQHDGVCAIYCTWEESLISWWRELRKEKAQFFKVTQFVFFPAFSEQPRQRLLI